MRIRNSLGLIVLAGFCPLHFVAADTVTWTQLARVTSAAKIAVCGTARLYYLDNDGWLWVDTNPTGRAPTWLRLSRLELKVVSLSCAADRLYALSSDKSLYRNDGDDRNVRWQRISRLPWASQVVAANFGMGAVFYGLNTDGVVLTSETGAEANWRKLGKLLTAVQRLSAPSLRDVFGLDVDGKIYVNHGGGLAPYWYNVDAPAGTMEIASANARSLYALAKGSLWRASVSHEVRPLSIPSAWLTPRANLILGNLGVTIREVCLSARVNPELLGEGRLPRPGPSCTLHLQTTVSALLQGYGLHAVDLVGPRLSPGQVSDFSSSVMRATLQQDRLELFAAFTDTRFTENSAIGPMGFDVIRPSLAGDLVPAKDSLGETVFRLVNFQFGGELHGTSVPTAILASFVNIKDQVTQALGPQLADTVATAPVQAAIRQILVQFANQFTGETWQGIAYGGIQIERGTLQFRVER